MASRVSRIYGDAYISLAEEESRREDAMKEAAALLQILDEMKSLYSFCIIGDQ
jgi:hypothetical protein